MKNLTNSTTTELVKIYNVAALFLGKPQVKKFSTKAVGLKRTENISAELEIFKAENGRKETEKVTAEMKIRDIKYAKEMKEAAAETARIEEAILMEEAALEQAAAEIEAEKRKADFELATTPKEKAHRIAEKVVADVEKPSEKKAQQKVTVTHLMGNGQPKQGGRTSKYAGGILTAMKETNPRRKGTFGYNSFQIILDNPGIPFESFLEAGGRTKDLRWDYEHGNAHVTYLKK
jgi:hypothetical protein